MRGWGRGRCITRCSGRGRGVVWGAVGWAYLGTAGEFLSAFEVGVWEVHGGSRAGVIITWVRLKSVSFLSLCLVGLVSRLGVVRLSCLRHSEVILILTCAPCPRGPLSYHSIILLFYILSQLTSYRQSHLMP